MQALDYKTKENSYMYCSSAAGFHILRCQDNAALRDSRFLKLNFWMASGYIKDNTVNHTWIQISDAGQLDNSQIL